MKKQILLLFLFALVFTNLKAQELSTQGKVFWLTFLENNNAMTDVAQLKVVVSSSKAASGTIKNPNTSFVRNFSLPVGGGVDTLLIPVTEAYMTGSGSTSSRKMGLIIQSNDTIAVTAQNTKSFSCDASLILPIEALSSTYRIISHPGYSEATLPFGANANYKSSFGIVATEDNTKIDITPSANLDGGGSAGVTFQITLQKGETYQVRAATNRLDLTGTLVQAYDCKRIAVFGGSTRSSVIRKRSSGNADCGYSHDNLYEQLMPIELWGKKFVTAPTIYAANKQRKSEMIKVVTHIGSTIVRVNGRSKNLIAAGASDTFWISEDAIIVSNKPIAVCQFAASEDCDGASANSNTDPMMMWLPSIEQSLKALSFSCENAAQINKFFVNIVVKTQYASLTKIDGATPSVGFKTFAYDTSYSYIQQYGLSLGIHNITNPFGFSAVLYAYGDHGSYGYNAGSSIRKLNSYMEVAGENSGDYVTDTIGIKICQGKSVTLEGFSEYSILAWGWKISDNTSFTSKKINKTFNDSGTYNVQLITMRKADALCGSGNIFDTINQKVFVYGKPIIKALPKDTIICYGTDINLRTSGETGAPYNWSPSDYLSCVVCKNPIASIEKDTMQYFLESTRPGCNPSYDTLRIFRRQPIKISKSRDTTICTGGNKVKVTLNASGGEKTKYNFKWNNGLDTGFVKTLSPLVTTKYKVVVSDGCTPFNDSVEFTIYVRPEIQLILVKDTVICKGNSYNLAAKGNGGDSTYTFTWDQGLGTGANKSVSPTTTTTYRVVMTDECTIGSDTDYVTVKVRPGIKLVVNTDTVVCKNTNFKLKINGSGGDTSSYKFELFRTSPSPALLTAINGKYTDSLMMSIPDDSEYKVVFKQACNADRDSLVFKSKVYDNLSFNPIKADTICEGGLYDLIANVNTGQSNIKYYLFTKVGANYILSDSTISNKTVKFTVSPIATTDYMITANDFCNKSKSYNYKLVLLPGLKLDPIADRSICKGASVNINLVARDGYANGYQFETRRGNNTILSKQSAFSFTPTIPDTYTVTVGDGNCSPTLITTFKVFLSPTINDSSKTVDPLKDCAPLEVNFKYPTTLPQAISNNFAWSWNLGDLNTRNEIVTPGNFVNGFSKTYNTPGSYTTTLNLVNDSGKVCWTSVRSINVFPIPIAAFDFSPKEIDIVEPIVMFSNLSIGANTYDWEFGDGFGSKSQNPIYTYRDTGFYLVTLISTSSEGCADTAYATLEVRDKYRFWIPNAFTPDHERKNTFFEPKGTNIEEVEMTIFNRWGQKVYFEKSRFPKWNGRNPDTGEIYQEGTYIYTMKVTDRTGMIYYYSGSVMLLW